MRSKNNLQGVRSITYQTRLRLDRMIRPYKTFIIGIVVVTLIITAFAVISSDSEGSCHSQASIKMIDETGGKDYFVRFSVDSNSNQIDSPFYTYTLAISKHVLLKIDEIEKCTGKADRDPQIELAFVYRPLYDRWKSIPFTFELPKFKNTRYLDSPWVKLTITSSPKLKMRAVFIWNQRQFMFDQAVLSGAQVSSTVPLLPLDRTSYWKFYRDYKEKDRLTLGATKQVVASILADLAKRIPADILWLFGHSSGFDGNLDAETALIRANKQQLEQYIFLTKQLLNRRFESKQSEQHYSSILDLKDILDLDKYRIDRIKYR
jgi:hypothetical protein